MEIVLSVCCKHSYLYSCIFGLILVAPHCFAFMITITVFAEGDPSYFKETACGENLAFICVALSGK